MAENRTPDFTGWATKSNIQCTDGRTIMPGAFKHMDKKKVPLVWMHQSKDPENVLGHALLEDRAFGTYAEGFFNKSRRALHMKEAVQHGDVDSLSIFANNLSERKVGRDRKEVYHGDIKEVSLVVAGANPGAVIENINMMHSDGTYDVIDDEAIITTGLFLNHSYEEDDVADKDEKLDLAHEDAKETVEDIFETMTEKQRNAALYVAGVAYEAGQDSSDDDDDDDDDVEHSDMDDIEIIDKEGIIAHIDAEIQKGLEMTNHNVFDRTGKDSEKKGKTLSHAQQAEILDKARKIGSLKEVMQDESILQHADYGVEDIDHLFPDHKMDGAPSLISRRVEWVQGVLSGVRKQPFAKIKSLTFDVTAEEARARGYVKGTEKKDEVVKLLKRTTRPTTVYKKQKLDRDDMLDITDFDIVAWLKWEIRYMLDEEIARAILIGDGRSSSHPDKIKDPEGVVDGEGIRSILHDHEMYAHRVELPANVGPEDRIEAVTRARSAYRGSGNPTFYTTDAEITDMLLLKDKIGRRLYGTTAELASVMRVKDIVPVEVAEEVENLFGIMVNLTDYTVGANKGGELSFFSDFDIDFNQEKYLMETRISGALNKPKAAVVLVRDEGTAATPAAPSFNGATNTITIPTTTGIIYLIDDDPVTGSVLIEEDTQVTAVAAEGYYIPSGTTRTWSFTYTD